jgi:hypothetical protein
MRVLLVAMLAMTVLACDAEPPSPSPPSPSGGPVVSCLGVSATVCNDGVERV